jgi:pimeloyl-ACP methyl ester carboxylesterase
MLARITALLGAPRISRARRQVDDPRPRRRAIATMRGVRALAVLVAAIVVWSGLAAGAATAAPARVAWSPCHAKLGPFQCGTVQVPLDYDEPDGAKISIALVRLPATDPQHRIGSLLVNPGGPGGSGVDFALSFGPSLYTDEVRARFDLVGFDPRGIWRSSGLRCFGTARQQDPYFTPLAFPSTPEEEQTWITADRYLNAACERRGGPIAEHMSSANVARDLDRLRQAVGDRQLTYAGFSYGSYIGVTYANLFPANVRALVIDGVTDPIAWSTGRGDEATTIPFTTRLRSDAGTQATLEEFFRLCDAAGPACAISGTAADRYAALAARLKAHPVAVALPDGSVAEINYSGLIAITQGILGNNGRDITWADFAQLLADLELQAAPARLATRLQTLTQLGYMTLRGFPRYPNDVEARPAVFCADSDNPDSYPAWSTAAADASGYFGRGWTWASSICAEWPFADHDRYIGPFDRMTANPVLVVGTQYDTNTRYQAAVTVANLLPSSALVTLHGWGHTSLGLSHCIDDAITRYLVDRAVPASGTVCEQDHVPFSGP